ncbi:MULTISPECIES: hypothetical protein [unclassified Streptomyces]
MKRLLPSAGERGRADAADQQVDGDRAGLEEYEVDGRGERRS